MSFDGVVIVGAVMGLYLAPAMIGAVRRHHAWGWLFWFNLGCGWMGYGWLTALIWAVGARRRGENTIDSTTGSVEYIHDPDPDDGERIPRVGPRRPAKRHRVGRVHPMKLKIKRSNADR